MTVSQQRVWLHRTRYRFGVVGDVVQDDDFRLIFVAFVQEIVDLHDGVVVSHTRIDHLRAYSTRRIQALDALREGLLERNSPTFGERITEHHYSQRRWRA